MDNAAIDYVSNVVGTVLFCSIVNSIGCSLNSHPFIIFLKIHEEGWRRENAQPPGGNDSKVHQTSDFKPLQKCIKVPVPVPE